MAYGKKRMYRKRPYKRKGRYQAKNKQVVSIVKRELHRQIENKQVTKVITGATVKSSMPTSIANGMYSIIPNIPLGGAGQGQRIGRQLKPLSLRLSINAYTNSLNATPDTPMWFDVWVFSFKKFKDTSNFDALGPTELSNFFRPSYLLGGTDQIYDGSVQNYYQNINRDVINLYAKKRFLMSPTGSGAQTPNQDPRWIENRSSRQFEVNIPLSKHLAKTFKYSNETDETPNNCAIFACVCCTETTAGINPPSPAKEYGAVTFVSTMVYEDA